MTIEPKINNMLFDSYNAKLLSFQIGFSSNSGTYHSTKSRLFPVKLNAKMSLRSITLKVDFEGSTVRDIETNISNFMSALYDGADILLPDGFLYMCSFDKATAPKEKAPWILQVTFALSGIRHDPLEQTDPMTSTTVIQVKGNYETPAIITAECYETPVTIAGITISDITGTIVIDGIKCKVTQNGVNKFANTNLTEFPKLKAGNNSIAISGNASVVISYYPIFI